MERSGAVRPCGSVGEDRRSLRNQALEDRPDPALVGHIPNDEIAFELPIGPAEAVALGFASVRCDVSNPQIQRGPALVIGAELAEQDGTMVSPRPGRDLVEIAADRCSVLLAPPSHSVQLLYLVARPGRALVGEVKRLVIMKGDQEVGISGELQE